MDFNLKITLINKIISDSGYYQPLSDFYTVDYINETYTWTHSEMLEPSQAELDAEKLVYDEEILTIDIRKCLNEVLIFMDSAWSVRATWYNGDYSNVIWEDVSINESNNRQRSVINSQISELEAQMLVATTRRDELQAITERNDIEENELSNILSYIDNISSQISDLEVVLASIEDVTIIDKPSWEVIKIKYEEYLVYKEARDAEILAEKEAYASMNVDLVIYNLLGEECVIGYRGTHYDDLLISSAHAKPSWEEMKTKWEEISAQMEIESQISNLDKTMDMNIFSKAAELLGTTKFESMMFFSQSWTLKRDYPEKYIDDGLTVFKATTSFQTVGESLDTSEKIYQYYNELCVEILIVIDKYRDNEIQNFLAAKAAL